MTPAAQAATERPDIAVLRDELLQALRDGGAIGDHLRPAVLRLIPTLDDWPRGLQIAFHAGDGAPLERYGSALDPSHEPVHVMQWSEGHYAATDRGDAGPEHWVDCGPDHDALFVAVLEGMQQRDGLQFLEFTHALAQRSGSPCTDAQRLRERLADQLDQSHPASMRTLRNRGSSTSQHGWNPIDAALLMKISAMGAEGIRKRGGLIQLAKDEHVIYSELKRHVRATGELRGPGFRRVGKTKPITASMLREIRNERQAEKPRSVRALALHYGVPVDDLGRFVHTDLSLKLLGRDLLWREHQPPVRPLTPDVVQMIATMVERGDIIDARGLLKAAHRYHVSFEKVLELIKPGTGLSSAGRKFLGKGWTTRRVVRAVNARQVTPGQPVTRLPSGTSAPLNAVTADMLLGIRNIGTMGIAYYGGLRGFAQAHHVSYHDLRRRAVSTGTLTPEGIKTVRKTYPDFRVDGATGTDANPPGIIALPGTALPDPAVQRTDIDAAPVAFATTAPSDELPGDLQGVSEEDLQSFWSDPVSVPARLDRDAAW